VSSILPGSTRNTLDRNELNGAGAKRLAGRDNDVWIDVGRPAVSSRANPLAATLGAMEKPPQTAALRANLLQSLLVAHMNACVPP